MTKIKKISRGKLNIKVKNAKTMSTSSAKWVNRHINDQYVQMAQRDGYRSRSAYKLMEINNKFKILKKNINVIDLGSAPGGWSQIISNNIKNSGKIFALDILEMKPIEHVKFIRCNFVDEQEKLLDFIGENTKFDLIVSDIAPNTSGNMSVDHIRILGICENILEFADKFLNAGGTVVTKIFQGGDEQELARNMKKKYKTVKYFKPESSRKDSNEIYMIFHNKL